jgi:hypothetical protein
MPRFIGAGRAQSGIHANAARTPGSPSSLAIGGTGVSTATQKLPSDARDTPSGTPGRWSIATSVVPAWAGAREGGTQERGRS